MAVLLCIAVFIPLFSAVMKQIFLGSPDLNYGGFLLHVALNVLAYFVLFVILSRLGVFRFVWGMLGPHIWPFCTIARSFALARFFRGLSMLLESGLSASRGIEGAARMCGSAVMARDLAQAAPKVSAGIPVAEALAESRYLSDMLRGMLRVGEESGKLDEMLRKSSQYCLDKGMHSVRRWVGSLEAMLILYIALHGLPGIIPRL
jgi:type IV pilus assembly protein PilC